MMRVHRFLSIAALITSFSLLYVYQQTEIMRFAYLGQKGRVAFEDLLDKNSILRYNIEKSASLVYVGAKIFKSNEFQMPDTCRMVKLNQPIENSEIRMASVGRETLLSKIFSVRKQAEAKTINP